ncbi:MAG: hypothetical protein H3C43_01290 [Leptonema sp. (in: Bacteria)]|nr:hypothetical protein [Leptonema sp. (in: bacteria)]
MLSIISFVALILIIAIGSFKPNIHIGILAIATAFIISFFSKSINETQVIHGFPVNLFLMLVGITLLFKIAEKNGTLNQLSQLSLKMINGNVFILPFMFFLIAFILSAIGPGNIASVALLAPTAMVLAVRSDISPLLMAIVICTGANAGAFSPVAPTGIISTALLQQIGVTDQTVPIKIFAATFALQSISAIIAILLFSNWSQFKLSTPKTIIIQSPFKKYHWLTFSAILILVVLVMVFKFSVGPVSFILVAGLWLVGADQGITRLSNLPWDAIFLLTGIATLISVIELLGGLSLLAHLISILSGKSFIHFVLALFTGIASSFSSSSGVVMPTFIPMIPEIMSKTGVENPVSLAIAICVGSHMVDVSPLSVLGALCVAAAPIGPQQRSQLFRSLLLWGFSMAVVSALLAYFFLDISID